MIILRNAISIFCLCLFACNQKKEKQEQYIQVADFLKGALAELKSDSVEMQRTIQIDSLPETIAATDYAAIALDVTPFLTDEISPKNFQKHFKETSFADASTNSITFSYQSIDKKTGLKQVDVHILPATESIEYIYLTRNGKKGDTSFTQKMLWKKGSNYTLYTELNTGQQTLNRIEKVRWQKKQLAP